MKQLGLKGNEHVRVLDAAEEGGFVVTFPDLPFGVTEGEDEDDALARAQDLLETILSGLMDNRAAIPAIAVKDAA